MAATYPHGLSLSYSHYSLLIEHSHITSVHIIHYFSADGFDNDKRIILLSMEGQHTTSNLMFPTHESNS